MYREHGRVIDVWLVILLTLWVLRWTSGLMPYGLAAVVNAAFLVGLILAIVLSLRMIYQYARNDPEVWKEKTPAWRLALLVGLLLIALASPWWAPLIFR
jgi:hypothetical protein